MMRGAYRRFVLLFGVIAIVLGVALLVQAVRDGGAPRYLLGGLFIALGTARLWMLRRV